MRSGASPEQRRQAVEMVAQGQSIRAVAEATGLPKSSLHDWVKRGMPAYATDPTEGSPDTPAPTEPPAPSGPPEPPNLNRIDALQRYVNLTANDVHHRVAVAAAQRIDPGFSISEQHHIRIRAALGKGDEPVRLAESARRKVPKNSGVMIALIPPVAIARQLAAIGTEPVDQMHVTLAFLGREEDYDGEKWREDLEAIVRRFAWGRPPLQCQISGQGRFHAEGDEKDAWYASIDAPALPSFREQLIQALNLNGFYPSQKHGFSPHMTLSYLDRATATPAADIPTPSFVVEALTLAIGEDWIDAPLRRRLSELAFAALAPPSYVHAVYDRWAMTEAQAKALADEIYNTRLDAYMAAINDQLAALGRPLITSITDPRVLATVRDNADRAAAGIRETYNRDLASEIYTQYIELRGTLGRQTSEILLDEQLQQWIDDRASWKSEQVAVSEFMAEYRNGATDFLQQNSLSVLGHVEPIDAECPACQEAVDLGIRPADELDPLVGQHPGCMHYVEPDLSGVALPADLWAGQRSLDSSVVA